MIIVAPDKTHQETIAEEPHAAPSLPGPPPSTPAKPISKPRRRRLRFIAYAAILLTFGYLLRSSHHEKEFRLGGLREKKFPPHPPHKPDKAKFEPSRLLKIEQTFLSVPNNDSAIAASRKYGTKPHLAGSEQDLATARMFLDLFQTELDIAKPEDEPFFDAGSRQSQRAIRGTTTMPRRINRPIAWIDTYYPVMNTGVDQKLELLNEDGSVAWEAILQEDGDDADPEAGKYKDAIPTWHGLSKGGDVTGPLVYVKYGRKEDFDSLVESGVDLTGTIALVRYGGVFRGLKVKAAQEAGCVGILIYSDPHDDGSVTESNGYRYWPHGPARNPTSVQRGSVQFLSSYPGDPTTPGYPAYKNATRMEATSIPSIPSLPISWRNGRRLLQELEQGVTSTRKVRMVNEVDNKVIPIYNTMAVIPGFVTEQAVVVGNHRDAWVMGAADPTSGSVCIHEVVRGLGVLLRQGWKPLRTIILASWDAEEYGLVGSTEWGEDFADWIQEHVVAYLNLDVSVSGSRYNLKGSPSLAHLIMDSALSVQYPGNPEKTLWDARLDRGPFTGPASYESQTTSDLVIERAAEELAVEQDDIPVGALGSGSDYTVMLQRLGVASTDMGFGSTLSDAVYHYHSIYDSQHFQETYADPSFHKHVAVAQHLGLMMLRLADRPILPINTTHYSLELFKYLDGVNTLARKHSIDLDTTTLKTALETLLQASLRLDTERTQLLAELERVAKEHKMQHSSMINHFKNWVHSHLGLDHREPNVQVRSLHEMERHTMMEIEPYLFAPEHAPPIEFHQAPMDIAPDLHHPHMDEESDSMMRLREIDIRLGRFEQGFLSENGIKDREWYRHLGVAPGKWKGYGATPFPALSEAIEIERNATLAKAEVGRLVEVIETLITTLTPSFPI